MGWWLRGAVGVGRIDNPREEEGSLVQVALVVICEQHHDPFPTGNVSIVVFILLSKRSSAPGVRVESLQRDPIATNFRRILVMVSMLCVSKRRKMLARFPVMKKNSHQPRLPNGCSEVSSAGKPCGCALEMNSVLVHAFSARI